MSSSNAMEQMVEWHQNAQGASQGCAVTDEVHQPSQTPVTHQKPRWLAIIYAIVVPRIPP